MVDTTIIDDIKASVRTEQLRQAAKKCYSKKIRNDAEFYACEKIRIKNYKNERYKNDPEYALKMKEKAREYYRRKKEVQTQLNNE